MTTVEWYISIGSVIIAVVLSLYAWHVARTSGRDRPHDPAAVKRFIEQASHLSADGKEGSSDNSVGARSRSE